MNSTKDYVDSLFSGYEETKALTDFKEELLSNLNAKVDSLIKKGLNENYAFEKAAAELGDVSALADEISLKKRQEIFEERYLDIRHYMKGRRVAAYTIFSLLLLTGIVIAAIAYFATGMNGGQNAGAADAPGVSGAAVAANAPDAPGTNVPLTSLLGSLMVFLTASVAGFTFLGLTQETASRNPMAAKRAFWYTLAAALLVFGIMLFPLAYFGAGGKEGMIGAIGTLIPFALPAIGILVFLALSEKSRLKPWARERYAAEIQRSHDMFASPAAEMRFGLISGAIWIFAAALFFIAGFAIGFKFSWVVFVLAVGMECLALALMSAKKNE
jgi:hypothetical protein